MYQSKIIRDKARTSKTSEIFTPESLVEEMLDEIPQEFWSDPTKTILEPSVGNGQFIEGILKRLMIGLKSFEPDEVLRHKYIFENQIYAIDLMRDNIEECVERFQLQGLRHHFVCHDALTYHMRFDEWEDKEELFDWPE